MAARPASAAVRVIAFVVAVAALREGRPVLLPIVIGALLAFALTPVTRRLERPLRSRSLAIGVVLVCVTSVGMGLLTLAALEGRSLVQRSASYRAVLVERLEGARREVRDLMDMRGGGSGGAIDGRATNVPMTSGDGRTVAPAAPVATEMAAETSDEPDWATAAGTILQAVATVLLTGFFLGVIVHAREDMRDRLVRVLGSDSLPMTSQTIRSASERLSQYLLAQITANASWGLLFGLAMAVLGVPSAALLGTIGAVLRFVPYLGTLLAGALGVLGALATDTGMALPALVIGAWLAIEIIVGGVIEPYLFSRRSGLSLMGVMVAITFWGWLWGVAGLIVAVPLTACLVLLSRHFPALEPISVLLGDEPALTPADRLHHRLMTGDAEDAVRTLQEAEREAGLEGVEVLWTSTLRRAAMDVRTGALGVTDLERYAGAAAETLDRTAEAVSVEAAPSLARPQGEPVCDEACVLVLSPARALDEVGARVISRMLGSAAHMPIVRPDPPILMSELVSSGVLTRSRAVVVTALHDGSRRRARLLARAVTRVGGAVPVFLLRMDAPASRTVRSPRTGVQTVYGLAALRTALHGTP